VSPTPAEQDNTDDCAIFAIENSINMLTNQPLNVLVTFDDARLFAIRARWKYLQTMCDLLLGESASTDRLEQVLRGEEVQHDPAVVEEAAARLQILAPPRKAVRQTHPPTLHRRNDRKFSKKQLKYVSDKSFLRKRISGIRDLIFRLLSNPRNSEGLTEEEMERDIRVMLERDGFEVPEHWNLVRLLRVLFGNQTYHFHKLPSGKWVVTTIRARELSTARLNSLRVKRCSPTLNPIDCPALLHIYVQRWSGKMGPKAYQDIAQRSEDISNAADAAFGRRAQQPETSAWSEGTHQYPMKVNCVLPNVRATGSLRDMFALVRDVHTALDELEEFAKPTFVQYPHHEGPPFAYRVIIMGIDGGSVNNDSFRDMTDAYPHLEGQLLICDTRNDLVPNPPVIYTKPMTDWMQPACLLTKEEKKRDRNHQHVLWGFLKFSMLADEWSPLRGQRQVAPTLSGSIAVRLEREQQRLACHKLLFSNTLMFYFRRDVSLAKTTATAEFTDPEEIRMQTHNGSVQRTRNAQDFALCVSESDNYVRVCRWCGEDQTSALWAHSVRPPQDNDSALGFVCDKLPCFALELEESERTRARDTQGVTHLANSKSSETRSDSMDSSDGNFDETVPVVENPCVLWHGSVPQPIVNLLDSRLHDKDGDFIDYGDEELRKLQRRYPKLFGGVRRARAILATHRRAHLDRLVPGIPAVENPCPLWHWKVSKHFIDLLDPLLHDKEGNLVDYDDKELRKLQKRYPEILHKLHVAQRSVASHRAAHGEQLDVPVVENPCPLWNKNVAQPVINLLDTFLHDKEGNLVDYDEKGLKRLRKRYPIVLQRLDQTRINVENHKKAHDPAYREAQTKARSEVHKKAQPEAQTKADSEAQKKAPKNAPPKVLQEATKVPTPSSYSGCKLWHVASRRFQVKSETSEFLDPYIHDDAGNFNGISELQLKLVKNSNRGVLSSRIKVYVGVIATHGKRHGVEGTVARTGAVQSEVPVKRNPSRMVTLKSSNMHRKHLTSIMARNGAVQSKFIAKKLSRMVVLKFSNKHRKMLESFGPGQLGQSTREDDQDHVMTDAETDGAVVDQESDDENSDQSMNDADDPDYRQTR
jgi:hypothetical protein